MAVVGDETPAPPEPKPKEKGEEKPTVKDVEAPKQKPRSSTIVIHEPSPEALVRSEAAATAARQAAEQMRDELKAITAQLRDQQKKPSQAPVAYKFEVKRDRNGRISEVIATPIISKDKRT